MPAGGAHGYVTAINIVPKREAGAAAKVFELPAQISVAPAVLQDVGLIGPLDAGFGNQRSGCAHRIQLHRTARYAHVPVGVEWSPLPQLSRVRERTPDFLGRVAQLSDQHKRPVLAILLNPRQVGGAGGVLLGSVIFASSIAFCCALGSL